MKITRFILFNFGIGLLYFLTASQVSAQFSIMLPYTTPSTGGCTSLPYIAEADHYGAAACVQMILCSCPDIAARNYHTQTDIYNTILLHNSEPASWFADPDGVEGALEDPSLSPCGNWVDYSNTDKNYVLGKMLYYMNTQNYLTPVSIGNNEHWVTVIGYQTDIVPPYSGTVTLQNIFFYDPNPGATSMVWVSGATWLGDSNYWGAPHSKAGSSWNNKYIAVIEPPECNIRVKVPEFVRFGDIIPVRAMKEKYFEWREMLRSYSNFCDLHPELCKPYEYKRAFLINYKKYAYYLITFEDPRVVAIFNAYNGSFEELRVFEEPRYLGLDQGLVKERMVDHFKNYGLEVLRISDISASYDPSISMGRFDPVISTKTVLKDSKGKTHELDINLNDAGNVVREPMIIDKIRTPIRKLNDLRIK